MYAVGWAIWSRAVTPPKVNLQAKGKDSGLAIMETSVDWQAVAFFPDLNGAKSALEIIRYLLPGNQAIKVGVTGDGRLSA
jgi:hypothetical protein